MAAQYLAASLQRCVVVQPLMSPSAVEQFLVQALAPRDAEVGTLIDVRVLDADPMCAHQLGGVA